MIGLMDCNNFFVSCERLFRPDLEHKPVLVLSSNDGCVIARSQEVKDLGISMGVPYFKVREICMQERVTVFSSNFTLYRDVSNRVMSTLATLVPVTEVYSIDEAFFTLPENTSPAVLQEIRSTVQQYTGIPVSIGVGSTKTIAKAASTVAKKRIGVCVLREHAWHRMRQDMSCGSVWGIGAKTAHKLNMHGVKTVADLLAVPPGRLRSWCGIEGIRLQMELSGISVYSVSQAPLPKQSMCSSRSFTAVVGERAMLESALAYHAARLGEQLRARGWVASGISITVAPSRHGHFALRRSHATMQLTFPTSDTLLFIRTACTLLADLYDSKVPYTRVGVGLNGILPAQYVTGGLFAQPAMQREAVFAVVDSINAKFGIGTVSPATLLGAKSVHTKAARRSPEYTTSWDALGVVYAR